MRLETKMGLGRTRNKHPLSDNTENNQKRRVGQKIQGKKIEIQIY